MKRLTLLRHAKSSWTDASLADHERILSARGERDAPKMGKRMAARKVRPSVIISSSAVRARRTAKLVAEALQYPAESLHIEQGLYLATAETILELICNQEDNSCDLLVVGHNPGLTELVNQLLPALSINNLPTSGAVAIDFQTQQWAEITEVNAELVFYDYPKNPELLLIED